MEIVDEEEPITERFIKIKAHPAKSVSFGFYYRSRRKYAGEPVLAMV